MGSATAYYAALYVVKFFRFLETFNFVQAINLEEFDISDLPLGNTGVIIVCEKAENYDLFEIVELKLIVLNFS